MIVVPLLLVELGFVNTYEPELKDASLKNLRARIFAVTIMPREVR